MYTLNLLTLPVLIDTYILKVEWWRPLEAWDNPWQHYYNRHIVFVSNHLPNLIYTICLGRQTMVPFPTTLQSPFGTDKALLLMIMCRSSIPTVNSSKFG